MSKTRRIGGRVPKKVKDACKAFIIERGLPFAQYGILLNLALKSYKHLSLDERETWTLEEVVKQGL